DFWIPVVLLGGGRSVSYAPDAVAMEAATQHGREEFQRKLRMANRSMRGVLGTWPQIDGVTRVQLLSHKVLRWLGLPLYLVALAAAAALAVSSAAGLVVLGLLLLPAAVTLVGGVGRVVGRRVPGADFGVHFLLVHLAALLGVIEALVGK